MTKPKPSQNTSKYYWTKHATYKMNFYGLGEQRIRAVIRNPMRKEEGIVKNTIAAMQPLSVKTVNNKPIWKQEIWAMYQGNTKNQKSNSRVKKTELKNIFGRQKQIRIISAWRYPGISPKNNPIPQDILDELSNIE